MDLLDKSSVFMKFPLLRNLIHFLAEFTSKLKYFEVFKLTSFTHKRFKV